LVAAVEDDRMRKIVSAGAGTGCVLRRRLADSFRDLAAPVARVRSATADRDRKVFIRPP